MIFEVSRTLQHTDKENLKWFIFCLLFLLLSNHSSGTKRLIYGVFFILKFVKWRLLSPNQPRIALLTFISFRFHVFSFFVCDSKYRMFLCQTFKMIKSTVMPNIVFWNLIVYCFCTEKKKTFSIFRICQLRDFELRSMFA